MIDSVLFEGFSGFVVDLDVTHTGAADGVLYDTFMLWFVLSGGGATTEVSFTF